MRLRFKYEVLMPLLAHLPQSMAYRLISFYARLSLGFYKGEREAIIVQMQTVFPDQQHDELARAADYFFCMIDRDGLDTWFFRTCKTQQQINNLVHMKDFHYVAEARQAGRHVIISSGHFGRFWMAGVGMKSQGISVGTITRDGGDTNEQGLPEAEYQYRLKKLAWLQQYFSGPFLVEGDSARPIFRALKENVMALFIDVPYEGDKNGCINLPFLGGMARFPLGPARVAKKNNALIVPFYVFESRSGLCAQFYQPVETEHLTVQEIMSQLVSLLEKQILAFPEQWWLWQALPMMRQQ